MNSRARLIKAIDNSACLTRRQINDYIYKKLFPEEQYVVEMHLNECPFCNDAIEGFLKTSNANQLLSEVDTLQLPAVEATPEPLVEKVVPKKEVIVPPVSKTVTEGPVHPTQRKTVAFDAPERKRGMNWKVGLAVAAVVGLGIWGLNQFNNHKAEKAAMLAKANESAGALDEGVSPPVSRQDDSAMNAKYGMQGQAAPVIASHSSTRVSNVAADSDAAMVAAADVPAAAAPASIAMSREAAPSPAVAAAKTAAPAESKAKTNATPVLAKTTPAETRAKAAEVVKEADMRTTSSSTTTTKPVATAVKPVATEKTVAKEKVRPSAKTPEERAKDAANKKAAAEEKAITQAEADFKKGMDLYKKKQYASALPYFQAVAKKPDMPNSKQAAKYVKLCKEQLAKDKDDK
ncbi:hypothetical protein [Edaphocola aurantiacus]|uniref:hypothetical protein n=1 Tax=Edaphocola aurantiacus TaxID=2601682 RepID=UPI001C93C3CF|nr:hypothetical protein [Edaphocola aurantiacus]